VKADQEVIKLDPTILPEPEGEPESKPLRRPPRPSSETVRWALSLAAQMAYWWYVIRHGGP
jgi:hypothetical protein